jgi:O-antigen ligase
LTAQPAVTPLSVKQSKRSTLAYRALLVFSVLYFARPEDLVPGLHMIPMGKITGGIALLALIFGVRGRRAVKKLPAEIKLLFLLLGWLTLTIPFAWWRGGAFVTVFDRFAKGVIVALLVSMLVTKVDELRKLLLVQAASLAVMTVFSIATHEGGRMSGVLGGAFQNPNDLAINIALNWPLAFAFFLLAKGPRKLFWMLAMFVMLLGIALTYSRSGFLAIGLCVVISLYQFGIKGRRLHLVGLAGAALVVLPLVAPLVGLRPDIWLNRMRSTVQNNVVNSYDLGSKEAREELLQISLHFIATHPLVGVGPGNFASVSGSWRVAHNTYTELGAEAGLPALFLFLLILGCAFRNLWRVTKSDAYKSNQQIQIFTGAMWASLGAYLVGAAFSDTQYNLFPYFMVAYTTALYHLACLFPKHESKPPEGGPTPPPVSPRPLHWRGNQMAGVR